MATKFIHKHHKKYFPGSPKETECKEADRWNSFLEKHHSSMKNHHKEKGSRHIGNPLILFSTAITPCSENSIWFPLKSIPSNLGPQSLTRVSPVLDTRPGLVNAQNLISEPQWLAQRHTFTHVNQPKLISGLSQATEKRGSLSLGVTGGKDGVSLELPEVTI